MNHTDGITKEKGSGKNKKIILCVTLGHEVENLEKMVFWQNTNSRNKPKTTICLGQYWKRH